MPQIGQTRSPAHGAFPLQAGFGRWQDLRTPVPDDAEVTMSSTGSPPVLIAGATGRTGRAVVDQLLNAGSPVRALASIRGPACALTLVRGC